MADEKRENKFKSRKFLLALFGAVVGVVGKFVGVPQIALNWVISLLGTYIVGEAAVDIARVNNKKKE